MEFLVRIHAAWPATMGPEERDRIRDLEARRRRELMAAGILKRQWRVPGRKESLCLYDAADATALHEILESMPFWPWLDAHVEPLAIHHLEQEALEAKK